MKNFNKFLTCGFLYNPISIFYNISPIRFYSTIKDKLSLLDKNFVSYRPADKPNKRSKGYLAYNNTYTFKLNLLAPDLIQSQHFEHSFKTFVNNVLENDKFYSVLVIISAGPYNVTLDRSKIISKGSTIDSYILLFFTKLTLKVSEYGFHSSLVFINIVYKEWIKDVKPHHINKYNEIHLGYDPTNNNSKLPDLFKPIKTILHLFNQYQLNQIITTQYLDSLNNLPNPLFKYTYESINNNLLISVYDLSTNNLVLSFKEIHTINNDNIITSFVRIIDMYCIHYNSLSQIIYYDKLYSFDSWDNKPLDAEIKDHIITMDLETYVDKIGPDNVMVPYSIGYCNNGEHSTIFTLVDHGPDFIVKCFKDLFANPSNHNATIYFHNFSKFDSLLIIKPLLQHYDVKTIYKDNSMISLIIRLKDKPKIRMVINDSMLLLKGSLANLGKAFNVSVIKSQFDHNSVNKDNLSDINHDMRLYLNNDVVSLYQILKVYIQEVYNKVGLNVVNHKTISGLAFNTYLSNDYKLHYNIKNINGFVSDNIRKSYYGGLVDVYKPYVKDGYYYDINSMYPYIMKVNKFPIGDPIYSTDTNLDNYFGFVYCKITAPDNLYIPILPYLLKGKLICPTGTWYSMYFSEEVKFAVKYGYKVEVLYGYKFNSCNDIFTSYIDRFYDMKKYSTSNNMPVLKQFSKDMLNCLYGRIGLKERLDTMKFVTPDQADQIIELYNYTYLKEIDDNTILIKHDTFKDPLKGFILDKPVNLNHKRSTAKSNIAIASAITAYSRMYINQFKLLDPHNVIYSDTDSLVLQNPLDPKFVGDDIGQFKLEFKIKHAYFVNAKVYGIITHDNQHIVKGKGVGSSFEDVDFNIDHIIKLFQGIDVTFNRKTIKIDKSTSTIKIVSGKITIKASITKRIKVMDLMTNNWIDTTPINVNHSDIDSIKDNLDRPPDEANNNTNTQPDNTKPKSISKSRSKSKPKNNK